MINHKKNIDGASYLKIKKEEEKRKAISSLFCFDIFDKKLLKQDKMPKPSRRVIGKPEPLTFNSLYGKGLTLANNNRQATRSSGFGDAIVFSSRTIRTYEKVFLKHRQKPVDWIGSLRVGFCMHDPKTQFTQETLPSLAFKHLTGF
jgi:hypothetical protein